MMSDSWHLKYRPRKLQSVIGQESAVTQLAGMLKSGRVPNAIMFSGPSGTGKTTLARIVARYLNCAEGNACGKCDSCKHGDNHPDILELNAADKRGIDDIRALIAKANYQPRYKKRVFVIDEFQGLTDPAQQAMLIPMESPPKHTLWCICTTDPQKILKAVMTRCTKVVLGLPSADVIAKRLAQIAEKEECKLDSTVYTEIANASGGHVREAIGLLQSVANMKAADPKASTDTLLASVAQAAGTPNALLATKLLAALYKGNSKVAAQALYQVTDTLPFVNLCLWYNQYALAMAAGVDSSKYVWHSPANRDFYKVASKFLDEKPIPQLMRVERKLVDLRNVLFTVASPEISLLLYHLMP